MENKSCCYGSYLLSSQLNWDGTCWQPRMKAVGLRCLVFINKAIYMKNKRTSLESIEEVTVMWEPTPSQDPFFFFPLLSIPQNLSKYIIHQWHYAPNNKAPSSHPTKIKYFGSVGNIQVKLQSSRNEYCVGTLLQAGRPAEISPLQPKKKKVNVYPV